MDSDVAGRADIRSVSFYIGAQGLVRARAAYEATNWHEGDRSWSHFVQKALLAEACRREARFNASRPFEGGEGPLKPGRPTVGVQLRAAELSDPGSDHSSRGPLGPLLAPAEQDDEHGGDVQRDRREP
jgi:hypothetical protein